ncbi:MAG: hypothetical protein LH468_04435 [Nocardioides sp.]|nr:hypothetical protein [Nocardioides sp.]
MTSAPRLAYDDLAPIQELRTDARRTGEVLGLPSRLDRAVHAATRPAPSIHWCDYPREVPTRVIRVSVAAQRCAAALGLHLD